MIECWATHILKENIKDRDYVFELYNWLMQEYDTTEWPSNHTDIDIFGEHIHPTLEPVHNFISQQVSQFARHVFGTDENLRIKGHATNHSSIAMHQHSGAVISGVFYVNVPHGNLRLLDPRLNAQRGYPSKFQNYFKPIELVPDQGDVILFPSFVWHEVTSFQTQQRVILPFDVYVDNDVH